MKSKIKYLYENADIKAKFKLNSIKYPIYAYLKITTKCMLKCSFCSQWGINNDDMEIEKAKEILNELRKLGTEFIYYTGGEPLLYYKIEELIQYGYELGFKQILVTNGLLFKDKRYRKLAKFLINIGVSLHGLPEIHNRLVGDIDCFDSVIDNIKKVQEENEHIKISINCTATNANTNYESFEFLAKLCKKNKWQLYIARLNYVGRAKNIKFIDLNNMLEIVDKLNEKGYYIKISNCIIPCVVDKKYEYLTHGCGAGVSMVAIESNGDVKICSTSNYIIGNLNKNNFKTIWNCKINNEFKNLNWLPNDCKLCKNFLKCRGGCKAEITGEYWKQSCDVTLNNYNNLIWKNIKNKKINLAFDLIRKEEKDKYLTISFPKRICNEITFKLLKQIDGTKTANEIAGDNLEKIDILVNLKKDNLLEIIN